ncbi:MAG: UDP-2,3-diacetamido-2,3-dideoxy-D-glucuronate 2-epimerase [Alphaproteobacteria bacterium MarineAlpha8_Bin1]|nr:MAG: UDP-2,3-diacetamido-2,3-dideoxy-D-glucuronate 2-epimerase [Alphaproteobacteria bacterium MarineAlpha8_Bin1]
MKVMTIIGTRPEIIRLSEIIKILDRFTNHTLVHTGQNYDDNLYKVFFKDLKLRKPDIQLKCQSKSIQEQISKILESTGNVMDKHKPEAIVILGDTNSGLSAIVAKRKKIPIFHLEAGDRSFDNEVPEELNRRIIDHTSDINLAYTEHSRRNLIQEGIHPKNIFVIGSPIKEVYDNLKIDFKKSKIVSKLSLKRKNYFLSSLHREENVDKKKNLEELIKTFNNIVREYKMPLIVSTHPRTLKSLEKFKFLRKSDKLVQWHQPFGLIDFIKLQLDSFCVISDSGTIHEDSAILKFPALAIRNSTEKYESLDSGYCPITGLNSENVLKMIKVVTDNFPDLDRSPIPNAYDQAKVSNKVINIILGLRNIVNYNTWREKK